MAKAVLTFDVERFGYDVRVPRVEGGLGLEGAGVQQWAGRATPDFTWRAYVSARAGAGGELSQAKGDVMEGWHLLMAFFGAPLLLWLYAMWRWGGLDIRGDLETARRKNRMRREERERGVRPVHPEDVPPIERLRGE